MKRKNKYNLEELMTCAKGMLFGSGNAQLPLPPMLMFDRITHISESGGNYGKGEIIAELDVKKTLGFLTAIFMLTQSCQGLWVLMPCGN